MSRKYFGMQSLDHQISNLLKPIFRGSKKEFLLINNLVKNWEDVVGQKHHKLCYPKSLKFSKNKGGAILTIAAYNSSIAFFLENNCDLIIERIATFYGFKAIERIIIKQEARIIQDDSAFIPQKLSQKNEEFLQKEVATIEDQELSDLLAKLGRKIIYDQNKKA